LVLSIQRTQLEDMTVAMLSGATAGALHAVTGPDHLLSLGPAALRAPASAGRIGLFWGAGHALGTLLLSLPLLTLAHMVHASWFAAVGDRLAGLALIAVAAWSWHSVRDAGHSQGEARNPFWVGLVHGVTGAGALLLVLPTALSGEAWRALLYLAAFAIGSTVAMALLTHVIGRVGHLLDQKRLRTLQQTLLFGAVALGSSWLLLP
jgi:nickel/cobalt transporter (NicO) family protein